MNAELVKTFRFDAAHSLSGAPEGHKCRNLHGHGYRVDVQVAGPVDPKTGWVMDFGDLKRIVQPLIDSLDHQNLNDIPGLENSTSELLAKFLWDRITPSLPGPASLQAVVVWESDTSRCMYRGG
ncbi:MAG: 6-carboxytetrahydropterin synthase QueD [Phycisphaerae bacterium]|nr:6-carboxytetrahydropterin synthase QueD [Phycisphaerae bacterium]